MRNAVSNGKGVMILMRPKKGVITILGGDFIIGRLSDGAGYCKLCSSLNDVYESFDCSITLVFASPFRLFKLFVFPHKISHVENAEVFLLIGSVPIVCKFVPLFYAGNKQRGHCDF